MGPLVDFPKLSRGKNGEISFSPLETKKTASCCNFQTHTPFRHSCLCVAKVHATLRKIGVISNVLAPSKSALFNLFLP